MRQYSIREPVSEKHIEALSEIPPLIRDLLIYRGISKDADAKAFLEPDYDVHTNDPFLLKDMEKAVDRILAAIHGKEKIGIYTDYDHDGIPAGVIIHDFFKRIGYNNFVNYIPHRHEEGYGLKPKAIEKLCEQGVSLVVTADLGITDVEAVEKAGELGVDVIITDHHLPGKKLPKALAIINHKQKTCAYPAELCGAGVAYKLVQALISKGDFDIPKGWEKWLLDMAALSTIGDRVPLVGENRTLAFYGLMVLRKSRRPGLHQLFRTMRMDQRYVTEDDAGFMIIPRINAASRMDHPMDAFNLLSTSDVVEAGRLAKHLEKINNERKGIVASMAKEIKKRLKALDEIKDVIVMGDPRWQPSLLGLAATSVADEYNKPVFLWGRGAEGEIKGSCRSEGTLNVVELMQSIEKLFLNVGGHAMSGGFSLSADKVHRLEDSLLKAHKKFGKGAEAQIIYIDKKLKLEDITWETARDISKLAPFGDGNPKPLFMFEKIVIEEALPFGKTKNHLKLFFQTAGGDRVTAIGFFMTPESFKKDVASGKTIDLVAHLEISYFMGKKELRLRVVDII